jgi:molybdopterin molybdotransferase
VTSASASGGMIPVAEALAIILNIAGKRPRVVEMVPVQEAANRVLAADLAALRSQPPHDVSSMDGFALRAADTDPPGKPLALVGESAAGHPFAGAIHPGEAIRINTGALLPESADAVLLQERADANEHNVASQIVLAPGTFIRRKGRDFAEGDVLLHAGTRLGPGGIALAGAMDHAAVPVFRQPRVAILATGDELVAPGEGRATGGIVATNAYATAAMALSAGATVIDLGIAKDDAASLHAAFVAAVEARADCLVTIGGASVGRHDLVARVAGARGAEAHVSKVAMRPGKPFNFASIAGEPPLLLAGLPGNPISALVCAHLFLMPLLAALQGDAGAGHAGSEPAILGKSLKENDEREDYLRAVLSRDALGRLVATPFDDQDSSRLAVFAAADALVIRARYAPPAEVGETCQILRIHGPAR